MIINLYNSENTMNITVESLAYQRVWKPVLVQFLFPYPLSSSASFFSFFLAHSPPSLTFPIDVKDVYQVASEFPGPHFRLRHPGPKNLEEPIIWQVRKVEGCQDFEPT